MDNKLSLKSHLPNTELLLLKIVYQQNETTGYAIKQLIQNSDYNCWVKIGRSSIYIGLEKLRKKKLIASYLNPDKKGKGPVPQKITITPKGFEILKQEIYNALASSPEGDTKFKLGLDGMGLLSENGIEAALEERQKRLKQKADMITKHLKNIKNNHKKILLEYSLSILDNELKFIDSLL